MRRMMTEKEIATVESLRKEGILSLKDSHGNPRFVEGDITMAQPEGITQTYGKWSLSGTHLMIVIMFKVSNNTTLDDSTSANINLPRYIFDKIRPLYNDIIELKTITGYASDYTQQSMAVYLRKKLSNVLDIRKGGAPLTLTADRNFRIQFDLLIDTE